LRDGFQETKEMQAGNIRRGLRYLAIAALLAAVCLEGYYIIVLRGTIKRQSEDLRNISVQLQLLKSERESLSEEISSAKKQVEDGSNGNTTQR
jgi:hypothetical protein